ncbi:hypothetical protein WJX77_010814 [Trebouxia sp. C0004]
MDPIQTAIILLLVTSVGFAVYHAVAGKVKGVQGKRSLPLPPSGTGIPYIGDTFLHIASGPRIAGQPHHDKLGSIYRTWFLGEQVVHIGDPDAVRMILNAEHDLVESDWPSTIRQLLGPHGIATMHGQQHLQARKMVAPAFAPKTALAYIPRTVELAESFCAEWADARTVQGFDGMKNFTFQVATELVVGFPESFINKEMLARQKQLWGDWLDGFLALPINLPGFAFHKAMLARKKLLAEYKDNIMRLKDQTTRAPEGAVKPAMQYFVELTEGKPDDYMSSMDVLTDVTFNLLFAGHDTTAATLTLLLRYLKEEPTVLQKLRDEQKQVIAEHGKEINSTACGRMPYADATVKEILRIQIIVVEVYRRALKTFECGGYTIPKGHKMALEMFRVIEEDPRWTKTAPEMAASKFNPDRWLSEEGRKAGSWIPFGSGPRMCLGYVFAMQEIKIMMAVLARGYDWQVDLTEPIKSFPIPAPIRGLPMTFSRN